MARRVPVAQLLGAHQVGVAERRRLALVAELFVGVGEQRPRRGVGGVGEHEVVHQLGDPAVVAAVERRLRRGEQRVGAAGELDVARARLDRRVRVQVAGLPSYQLR